MPDEKGKELLDRAFEGLERETPDTVYHILQWVRDPKSRWIRLPLGILCIIASFFWFLPVVGLELFPIGLLLIAVDVPFLRRPVARMMLWLEEKWVRLRRRYREWRRYSPTKIPVITALLYAGLRVGGTSGPELKQSRSDLVRSRRTSRALLSERRPRKRRVPQAPSAVHSTNRICASSSGLTTASPAFSSAVTPPPQRVN